MAELISWLRLEGGTGWGLSKMQVPAGLHLYPRAVDTSDWKVRQTNDMSDRDLHDIPRLMGSHCSKQSISRGNRFSNILFYHFFGIYVVRMPDEERYLGYLATSSLALRPVVLAASPEFSRVDIIQATTTTTVEIFLSGHRIRFCYHKPESQQALSISLLKR